MITQAQCFNSAVNITATQIGCTATAAILHSSSLLPSLGCSVRVWSSCSIHSVLETQCGSFFLIFLIGWSELELPPPYLPPLLSLFPAPPPPPPSSLPSLLPPPSPPPVRDPSTTRRKAGEYEMMVPSSQLIDGHLITLENPLVDSPVILSQKKGQPGTNCKRRFLKCFLHKKMYFTTY